MRISKPRFRKVEGYAFVIARRYARDPAGRKGYLPRNKAQSGLNGCEGPQPSRCDVEPTDVFSSFNGQTAFPPYLEENVSKLSTYDGTGEWKNRQDLYKK